MASGRDALASEIFGPGLPSRKRLFADPGVIPKEKTGKKAIESYMRMLDSEAMMANEQVCVFDSHDAV